GLWRKVGSGGATLGGSPSTEGPGRGLASAAGPVPPCSRRLSSDMLRALLVARGGGEWLAGWRGEVVLLLHVVEVDNHVVVSLLIVGRRTEHHFDVALLVIRGGILEPLQHQSLFRIDNEDDVGVGNRRRDVFARVLGVGVARGGHQ